MYLYFVFNINDVKLNVLFCVWFVHLTTCLGDSLEPFLACLTRGVLPSALVTYVHGGLFVMGAVPPIVGHHSVTGRDPECQPHPPVMTIRLSPDMLVPPGRGQSNPGGEPLVCPVLHSLYCLDTLSLSLLICEMGVSTVPFLQGCWNN